MKFRRHGIKPVSFFVYMALQPVSGYQWSTISGTAAGTTTLKDSQAMLARVIIPASATGTVTFYDSSSGTSSSNFEIVNDTVDFPTTIELGVQMRNGLTYAVGGTTNMIAIYN